MPRRLTATLAVALLAALSLITTSSATAAPVDVASAPPLHWGFKESWRNYVGPPAASGGAAVVPAPGPSGHQVAWSFASGSYDAETGTTALRYTGSVHWTKYFYPDNPAIASIPPGYDGPLDIFLLDVGFWQDVDPTEDDNIVVDGDTLTVARTDADQDGAQFRARIGNAVATAYTKAAKLMVAAAIVTPRALTGVRLDWTGSDEIQALAPNQTPNFLSAGVSDGSEATYKASAPHVRVLQVAAGGDETPAAWATRGAHTTSGGRQLVRLTGGAGSIAADGTATVAWAGTFSVNFYGGLVPFTVKNLKLVVSPDGGGTLKGDLSGYGSSQANPDDRMPVPTVEGVTVATFSGARVDPDGETTQVIPAYAGVTVDLPSGAAQQARTSPGWGAWPQSFVDFQVKTGLSPYWYSSGGVADARKPPHPFAVTVTGVAKKTRTATLATLSCPKGGAVCAVTAPKTVRIMIGGRAYTVTVVVAKTAKAGSGIALRVRLTTAALKRLHGRTATVKVKTTITTGDTRATRTISARVTA